MRFDALKLAVAATVALTAPSAAEAAQFVTFGSRDGGAAAFDAAVFAGGDAVTTIAMPDLYYSVPTLTLPGGVTIDKNDGSNVEGSGVYYYNQQSTTAGTIDISPYSGARGPIDSGVTFTFDTPINAFGFEVGDWGTCCQPSALYISFDDGAPIRVGLSQQAGDVFITQGEPIVFVGAFDDSGSFSKVQFWGDGYGEYLVIGGTLRTANVDQGTIGDGSSFADPLLPNAFGEAGEFIFSGVEVRPGVPIVIDPDVAIGYDFMFSGALALSAEFEDLGDADGYDIFLLDGTQVGFGFMPGIGNVFDFTPFAAAGVAGFSVRDIGLNLDPTDPTAFATSLLFNVAGPTIIDITQTPILGPSSAAPEPATWAMLIGGIGLAGGALRRRRAGALRLI